MQHHGYGSDDAIFEAFRRQKNKQRRQQKQCEGKSGAFAALNENLRAIEQDEQRAAQEMQLKREMFEFVRDTTKLAAGVLTEVSDEQGRQREEKVSVEADHFFHDDFDEVHEHDAHAHGLSSQMQVERDEFERLASGYVDAVEDEPGRHHAAGHAATYDSYHGTRPGLADDHDATPEGFTQMPVHGEVDELHGSHGAGPDARHADGLGDLVEIDDEFGGPDEEELGHMKLEDELPTIGEENQTEVPAVQVVPEDWTAILEDDARCRQALLLLVKGGVLHKHEARRIYVESQDRR